MNRIRLIGLLVAALGLLASACGVSTGVVAGPQPETEVPDTVDSEPAESSTDGEPGEAGLAEPAESADAGADDPAAPDDPDDPDAPVATSSSGEGPSSDAEELLASAVLTFDGRSFRGEATLELEPGSALSAALEFDAEGDLAAITEIPPGIDPELPDGAELETRYVGGMMYVRPPVPAEVLAELGLEEAWYVEEFDPAAPAPGSAVGATCIFPQTNEGAAGDCDPLGETGAFLRSAREPEIVGREDLRGVETTRVRFLVSLMDLVGEALGMAPDDDGADTSGDGVFDDRSSDPFAEDLDQLFGFLDTGFEVEVWIDDDNLVRRIAFDYFQIFAGLAGTRADADAETPSSLVSMEFYDFDADVSVDAPPPEAIVGEDLLRDNQASSEEYTVPEYEPSEVGASTT